MTTSHLTKLHKTHQVNGYESKQRQSLLCRSWSAIKECFQLDPYQKNRLKGLLIIVIGVVAGSYMQYASIPETAADNLPQSVKLIVNGMVQMAYMFATAVAAVYITHGYELNQKHRSEQEKGESK